MKKLTVIGAKPLVGEVFVHGAKNAVLPLLAATLLSCGETTLNNCPNISDVDAAVKILMHLGCKVYFDGSSITVNSSEITRYDIPDNLMREMRSSVIFLGAILGRCKNAVLSMPGGCELGPRPIDIHIEALKALGAEIKEENGNIICSASILKGCRINLPFPSVGVLAAAMAEGTTVITNAACEPEIVDLQNYLKILGAKISGAGSPTIIVEGCTLNRSAEYTVIPDRIAAATFLSAAASTKGKVLVSNVCPKHIDTVTDALSEMGCAIKAYKDKVFIDASGNLKAIKPIVTKPYPGFPTDAQPVLMAATLKAEGTTVFVENIFSNRFRHVAELLRMGADIKTEGRVAMVSGVKKLHGAPVVSTDLRGGAALIVAALGAEGKTDIFDIHHIERGYDSIEKSIRALGGEIYKAE